MPRHFLGLFLLSLLTITAKAAPLDATPTTIPTVTPTATLTMTPTSITYIVQAGDNLFRIALRYGVTVEVIVQANHLANATNVLVGQTLMIPGVIRTATSTPTFTPSFTATLLPTVPTAGSSTATLTSTPAQTSTPTTTRTSTSTPTASLTPTATSLPPTALNKIPIDSIVVMPESVMQHVRQIYAAGQKLGRNAHAFSKLGDSTIETPYFDDRFDTGPYNLGPFGYLQPVITYFRGSFSRQSAAVIRGLRSWSVLDPMWADKSICQPNEHMLACEIRLHNPSILIIKLGSNDAGIPDTTAKSLRQIVEYCISNGVIPVLGTKADRHEGAGNINNNIVRKIAADYNVPLWDFDLVAQTLPGSGLAEDGVHLTTFYAHDWNLPEALQRGYGVHSLTALMVLNAVLQTVSEPLAEPMSQSTLQSTINATTNEDSHAPALPTLSASPAN